MTTQNKRLTGILMLASLLLLVPFIAMQFTSEVHWSAFDFLVAAALLYGAGLTLELVLRKVKQTRYRLLLCAAVVGAFILVWAELAVGIIGSPLAGS